VLTCIEHILDTTSLEIIREQLADPQRFTSGVGTAAGRARAVKHNLQGVSGDPQIRGISRLIEQSLEQHPVFQAAARPRQMARLLLSRYEPGMGYGSHIDAPHIDGVRTDVSFTLFLSEPDSYQGGELVIESGAGEDAIKLPAGAMVCYPSSYLHRVEPVTHGVRLVAVGWLQSAVRSAEQRALLFEMDSALAKLREPADSDSALAELANVRANLLRMWMD